MIDWAEYLIDWAEYLSLERIVRLRKSDHSGGEFDRLGEVFHLVEISIDWTVFHLVGSLIVETIVRLLQSVRSGGEFD